MNTKVLLTGAGVAALSFALTALPSPSASAQDQDDASRKLQEKIEKALQQAEKVRSKDYQLIAKLAQQRALMDSDRAMAQYESALQNLEQLQDLKNDDSDQLVSVLADEEGPSWLGVETREVTAENMKELKLQAERGVIVDHVTEDSPAAKAGLKENDVITEVNGQRVEGAAQFRRMIHEIPAGRTVQIAIWRDGRAQTLSATLGKAEENHRAWLKTAPGSFAFAMPKVMEMPDMPSIDLNGETLLFPGSARLGIDAEDLSGQLGVYFGAPDGEGILVRSVNSGSPAEKAGVKAGDVITTFNGDRVRTAGDLREKLAAKPDEKQVKLGVLRNKSQVTLTVELPERFSKSKHKVFTRRTYI
jgi:C-terminal processing protease CtpA/Prc